MTPFEDEIPFSARFAKMVQESAKRPWADRLQILVDIGSITPEQREAAIQRGEPKWQTKSRTKRIASRRPTGAKPAAKRPIRRAKARA